MRPCFQMQDDVEGTIRFRKGLEDAIQEEIFYYDQIKQWRLRSVDRGTANMTVRVT